MYTEVIMAGFGGQGVMLIGQFLAYSALAEGHETCWIPSYGPEMRGGTANCTVVISDRPIGSPVVYSPAGSIVMNKPSLDKFGPMVKSGGILIINSSLIDTTSPRTDISIYRIPANQMAIDMGNPRTANMVLLGAYIGITKVVKIQSIIDMVEKRFASKPELFSLNKLILQKGYEIGISGEREVVL